MKKLGIIVIGAFLIVVASSSLSAKTARYIFTGWTSTVTHTDFGAAIYYEEPVDLTYTPEVSLTVNQEPDVYDPDATLRQNLQMRGTVRIYRAGTSELIEEREFVGHERIVDEGMDAGTWVPGPRYLFTNLITMEAFDFNWEVKGVFHFQHKVRNGESIILRYSVHGRA